MDCSNQEESLFTPSKSWWLLLKKLTSPDIFWSQDHNVSFHRGHSPASYSSRSPLSVPLVLLSHQQTTFHYSFSVSIFAFHLVPLGGTLCAWTPWADTVPGCTGEAVHIRRSLNNPDRWGGKGSIPQAPCIFVAQKRKTSLWHTVFSAQAEW